MGLDLVAEACAKAGHEAEWRRLLEKSFGGDEQSDADVARFREISIPPYERIGAPRVGQDPAADAWIVEQNKATTPDDIAAVLKEFDGYHAIALVQCDGVPKYSNGGLYDGVDETSFRGAFLPMCSDVLSKELIEQAWDHKMPEAAVAYGRGLLAAADAAIEPPPAPPRMPGLLARLGLGRQPTDPTPFAEQLDIARAAGRWFIFWGERGHAIRAWF
ncbi:hypothetical protein [Phenylobacterium sp.]|uniref:hypothetical protein n=1 Tax=Phenylobacterium sp. TaxID=1871053 RepID=UPI002ED81BCD